MKESKLIQMEQRLMQIAKLLNQVAEEQNHLRELAVGTLKTIQNFKEYDEALEKLKAEASKESSQAKTLDLE
tara:strand:- start:1785 stop:2000 length:216 start_codon:yes stop_codon:yes gene_type:complete